MLLISRASNLNTAPKPPHSLNKVYLLPPLLQPSTMKGFQLDTESVIIGSKQEDMLLMMNKNPDQSQTIAKMNVKVAESLIKRKLITPECELTPLGSKITAIINEPTEEFSSFAKARGWANKHTIDIRKKRKLGPCGCPCASCCRNCKEDLPAENMQLDHLQLILNCTRSDAKIILTESIQKGAELNLTSDTVKELMEPSEPKPKKKKPKEIIPRTAQDKLRALLMETSWGDDLPDGPIKVTKKTIELKDRIAHPGTEDILSLMRDVMKEEDIPEI